MGDNYDMKKATHHFYGILCSEAMTETCRS